MIRASLFLTSLFSSMLVSTKLTFHWILFKLCLAGRTCCQVIRTREAAAALRHRANGQSFGPRFLVSAPFREHGVSKCPPLHTHAQIVVTTQVSLSSFPAGGYGHQTRDRPAIHDFPICQLHAPNQSDSGWMGPCSRLFLFNAG